MSHGCYRICVRYPVSYRQFIERAINGALGNHGPIAIRAIDLDGAVSEAFAAGLSRRQRRQIRASYYIDVHVLRPGCVDIGTFMPAFVSRMARTIRESLPANFDRRVVTVTPIGLVEFPSRLGEGLDYDEMPAEMPASVD